MYYLKIFPSKKGKKKKREILKSYETKQELLHQDLGYIWTLNYV